MLPAPHRYLTVIGDHDTGTVVDIQSGRSEQSLTNFYDSQSDSALEQIEVVSMDVSSAYTSATRSAVPHAIICYDGFHVMQWIQRALDQVFAESIRLPGHATADWKAARWALRTGRTNSTTTNAPWSTASPAPTGASAGPGRSEQARDLYRYDHPPGAARRLLKAWITAAARSRIPVFVSLSKRFQKYFDSILAAIELGISNALIEGINAKIRLINARGYGHHSARTLTSMIYLCLGGLQVTLPTRT
ncbi:MAG: transposase [Mycobacterium sp.]